MSQQPSLSIPVHRSLITKAGIIRAAFCGVLSELAISSVRPSQDQEPVVEIRTVATRLLFPVLWALSGRYWLILLQYILRSHNIGPLIQGLVANKEYFQTGGDNLSLAETLTSDTISVTGSEIQTPNTQRKGEQHQAIVVTSPDVGRMLTILLYLMKMLRLSLNF